MPLQNTVRATYKTLHKFVDQKPEATAAATSTPR
jgi:hypothetical protein